MHTFSFEEEGEERIYNVYDMFPYVNSGRAPRVQKPLSELAVHLDDFCWGKHSPRSVLAQPNIAPHHTTRIQRADLDFPLIYLEDEGIIDGMHRLARAYQEGREKVTCYIFTREVLEKFRVQKKPLSKS